MSCIDALQILQSWSKNFNDIYNNIYIYTTKFPRISLHGAVPRNFDATGRARRNGEHGAKDLGIGEPGAGAPDAATTYGPTMVVPSGKHRKSSWKWPFTDDLPSKNV